MKKVTTKLRRQFLPPDFYGFTQPATLSIIPREFWVEYLLARQNINGNPHCHWLCGFFI